MTNGSGFAVGLSCGMGCGMASGIGIGKNTTRKEVEKKFLEYCEQNEIIIQSKDGELIPIESFVNEIIKIPPKEEKIKKVSLIVIGILGVIVFLGILTLFLVKFLH